MESIFIENPLILIFTVAAVGYIIGKIKFLGVSLGVAAILFAGLAFGAVYPDVDLPEVIFQLGLIFFVYSVGISSGPAFFRSIKINGIRDIGFGILMLTISAVIALGIFYWFGLDRAVVTGIYTGSTTNTPALVGVLELINQSVNISNKDELVESAVIAYSLTYPLGVVSSIIAIILMEKILKVDYKKEANDLQKDYPVSSELSRKAIKLTNESFANLSMRDMFKQNNWNLVFGRYKHHGGEVELPNWDTKFALGDIIMVVGNPEEVADFEDKVGQEVNDSLRYDGSIYDTRRIFVSNQKVVGKTISELNLNKKFHAVITRIRRGDIDMLAHENTKLELGDRVRFVARRQDLTGLSDLFGDSYYEASRINLLSFGLGIALGLLLGAVEFNLPGGLVFKLGLAGGPIVVALILGALQRTGPIVWNLPYSVNVTLQQIGLILLLATIGIKSGPSFMDSFAAGGTLVLIGGLMISLLTAILTIFIGYKIVKIPFTFLTGIVSNQPAILEFATSRSNNRLPVIAYSMIFPISLIIKILYAQLLFIVMG